VPTRSKNADGAGILCLATEALTLRNIQIMGFLSTSSSVVLGTKVEKTLYEVAP